MTTTMRRLVLLVCLTALFLAGLAHAQETGGSMGGADFSSGDSGGSSDSGSSSGGYDSGSSSSGDSGSYSSGGGSSSGGGGGMMLAIILIVLVFMLVGASGRRATSVAADTLYLSSLMLGIDWHARGALQKKFAALAARKLGGTAEGRVKMLHEVVLALTRAELSWLYVAFEPAALAPAEAESRFLAACNKARSRFRRELIRNEGSELMAEEPGAVAIRPEEGLGTVVVSLILVTRRPLSGKAGMSDAAEIRAALSDRAAVTSADLVAVEVVWSPAAEDDRMSTSELEQHYPELVVIDPKSIAGRIFCPYCGGAFAMELLNCPHCGAAVADSKTHEE
jgi:uncharacterized membrane protein